MNASKWELKFAHYDLRQARDVAQDALWLHSPDGTDIPVVLLKESCGGGYGEVAGDYGPIRAAADAILAAGGSVTVAATAGEG